VTPTARLLAARALAVAALGLPLAACGGTASSSTSSVGASTAASPSTSGCGVAQQISVSGSKVTPPPPTLDVKAGCEVRLTITADRSSEVHVHVVDLEKPITAGKPLTISFTPAQQGVYEVELHDPDLLLVKLAVR
jgi:Flp pilus assembly protein TadD